MGKAVEQRSVIEVKGKITQTYVNFEKGIIETYYMYGQRELRDVVKVEGKITQVNIKKWEIEFSYLQQTREESGLAEIYGTQEYIEKYFPIVPVTKLDLYDKFLKHEPESENQRRFKRRLISIIKSKMRGDISDFRAQRMDACFDKEGNICFKAGMKPAVGKKPDWWKKTAEKFMPEKESRLGTTYERIAFLGLLMKYLVEEEGILARYAWKYVCDESRFLGHYLDTSGGKYDFEVTGSRKVGKWYDLANTRKIIVDDDNIAGDLLADDGCALVSGCYCDYSFHYPLAGVNSTEVPCGVYDYCVGWLVLSV